MRIRPYRPDDCPQLAALFYDTVHAVNARDYSPAQLDAWATGQVDLDGWNQSLSGHNTAVAEQDGQIVGFGDMDSAGYLDRLYVHKDWQRQGVATAICNVLEQTCAQPRLETHASITARPFFQQRGYRVVRPQQVQRGGVLLTNFVMEKLRPFPQTLGQDDLVQLERIAAMERALWCARTAVEALQGALAQYRAVLPQLEALRAYYSGAVWQADYQADQAGRVPAWLARSVLTEDALFDLLGDAARLKDDVEALAHEQAAGEEHAT